MFKEYMLKSAPAMKKHRNELAKWLRELRAQTREDKIVMQTTSLNALYLRVRAILRPDYHKNVQCIPKTNKPA